MIKAIIFDVFGVLITDGLSQIVSEIRETNPQKANRIVGLVALASKGAIEPRKSREAVASELGLTLEEYIQQIRSLEAKNHKLLVYIKSLRKNYKTAILSNVISGGLEVRFTKGELFDCFDVVISSGDTGYIKPEREIYDMCAKDLAVDIEECLFIDDRLANCEGAIAAGMQAIQYKHFTQLKTDLEKLLTDSNNQFFG
jgi:HAD superfamily hydrolase (TIGR01509 family)